MAYLLKNLSIKTKLLLVGVISSVGFIVFGAISYSALNFLKVNGPLYERIVQGKDIIADVLPPPKYIIESYLLALQMSDEMDTQAMERLISESKRLSREYEERQAFWLKVLPEGRLKNEMVKLSDEPVREFYKIRDEQFIPLLRRGEIYNARVLALQKLKPFYEKHRKHIDQVVELAKKANKNDERYAREIISKINLQLILIGLTTLVIILALSVYVIKQITSPLLKLTKAAEEISSGNLSREVAVAGGKDELGSLAISFDRMRLELQRTLSGLKDEISVRKKAQESARLLQSTTVLISRTDNLDNALLSVLRIICEFAGWVTGEAWVFTSDKRRLECGPTWHAGEGKELEEIIEESRKITFSAGEGLVGQAWVSQRPIWIADISQETNFLRKRAALAAGLKTAIFIPLIAEGKTLAVMNFFGCKLQPRNERLIDMVSAIGNELGMLILRQRYEHELLRANQELLKLDLMKSEFITNVSHELRTPLAMIKEGLSQSVEGLRGELSMVQKRPLEVSLSNVERLTRIINSILEISSYDAHKIGLKKENVDIVSAARQAISQFSSQAAKKGLEIKENFSHPAVECSADKEKVVQVFSHLIYNAVKFTDKGCIEVSVWDKDGTVECSVSDTGIGIPEEEVHRVFERFRQFHRTYGPGEKGVGLGLAIIKEIIELHQGKIWVESQVDKGTKFSFSLPKG